MPGPNSKPAGGKSAARPKPPFSQAPNKHTSKALRRALAKLKLRHDLQPKDTNGYHFVKAGSMNPRSR